MAFSEEFVQQVWEKARVVPEQDPTTWRKDECGAWIKRNHYEDRNSEFGWKIDHIIPGGPNDLSNRRVLQWQNYVAGGSGRVICKVTAEHGGINNKEIR